MKRLYALLLLPLFYACNKMSKANNVLFDKEVKQKYTYKSGNYWIYRDSLSGEKDSFFLESQYFKNLPTNTQGSIEYEEIAYNIRSNTKSHDTIILNIGLKANNNLQGSYIRKNLENYTTFFLMYSNSDKLSQSKPITEIPRYIDGNTGICMINKIGKLNLGANVFHDVYEIKYQISNNNNISTCYFNDSIGFIKINVAYNYNGSIRKDVWELQEWKINK